MDSKKLAFRPSVYGILIEKNKVLLSKQWDGYDFPGGGAKLYETVDDTLKREFWEETGLKITKNKIMYVGSSFWNPMFKKYWNCQLIFFSVKKIGGKLSTANFDEYEKKYADLAEWIDIKNLSQIKFRNSLGDQTCIKIIKDTLKNNYV